ncbi:MAG TPA: M23 family metallopeptidase [Longimicrobiales bacterium]|nr:M23 family metallopeptidase [Longimicrobiales bacterium]
MTVASWQPAPVRVVERERAAPVLEAVFAPPVERVDTHMLARGQTLSDVLSTARLSDIPGLLPAVRQYADPRRMKEGTEIMVRRWVRAPGVRSVDIRLDPDRTLHLVPEGAMGWSGQLVETPVELDTVYVAELIHAGESIWDAMYESEDDGFPVPDRLDLVLKLARVYEFKLDLRHDIQPGDRFRFVYERESRPDGTARATRILAAEFENRGTLFPAIHFAAEDEGGEFYDVRGHSLRNAFLRYPVEFARITSSFNPRRYHPVLGVHRAHVGTDFGARAGTPVRATASGVVEFAGLRGGYGNLLILRHPGGYSTRYAHLRRFQPGIRAGVRVKQEDVVAEVGATGMVTAAHLHYEFRKDGRPMDVMKAQLPASRVLPPREMERFRPVLEDRTALLERGPELGDGRFAARPGRQSAAGGM